MTTDAHKPALPALFVVLWRLRLAKLLLRMARRFERHPLATKAILWVGSLVLAPAERKMFGSDFDKARE
jgi:hypothetical protein